MKLQKNVYILYGNRRIVYGMALDGTEWEWKYDPISGIHLLLTVSHFIYTRKYINTNIFHFLPYLIHVHDDVRIYLY